MNRVYAREARLLQRLERRFTQSFDRCLVISEAEASILRDSQGDAGNVVVVPNGVDIGYFDPALEFASPFDAGFRSVVFTGAMDYYANIDGVVWFVDNVWRRVHAGAPDALFHIVGSNPTRDVLALRDRPGVRVVGRVPDMRPYLAHANAVVAPLRLARGVQNKVLEALAMARPVVATSNALQGISAAAEGGVRVADDGKAFAEQVLGCLTAAFPGGHAGRDFVTARFCWQSSLDLVCAMFRAVGTPVRPGSIASAA